ncbi:MAG: hypothetical protein OEM15_02930 [Myxococcales bacterium]|nr:hypothetical protein [Myxococcales bacterium]MDH3483996.1 hypothetical protein [Myxococcales bacterium]
MIDPVVSVSLRCVLALLFATAAWHKVSNRDRFASTLEAYRLLPTWLGKGVARGLPVLEIAIAVSLLLPLYRPAALGAAVLLVLYSVAIAINLARGRRDIDCGCFGRAARVPLSETLLLRNAVFIAAAAAVHLPVGARPLLWMDGFTAVAVLTVTTLLWGSLRRLGEMSTLGGSR